jgi:hypothetical protein
MMVIDHYMIHSELCIYFVKLSCGQTKMRNSERFLDVIPIDWARTEFLELKIDDSSQELNRKLYQRESRTKEYKTASKTRVL